MQKGQRLLCAGAGLFSCENPAPNEKFSRQIVDFSENQGIIKQKE